jgi:hypothetical protein
MSRSVVTLLCLWANLGCIAAEAQTISAQTQEVSALRELLFAKGVNDTTNDASWRCLWQLGAADG